MMTVPVFPFVYTHYTQCALNTHSVCTTHHVSAAYAHSPHYVHLRKKALLKTPTTAVLLTKLPVTTPLLC